MSQENAMFLYKVETRDSEIAGRGVYAQEAIPMGAVVGLLDHHNLIMTEEEYQDAQRRGEHLIIQSAVRLVGDYFVYNASITDEEYINHSESPNMLYHCGKLFAKASIGVGDELTVDYKYFLATDDVHAFDDRDTGRQVTGLNAREALLQSCREVIELYSRADFQPPRYSDYAAKKD
jgi:SET domain-containing protein